MQETRNNCFRLKKRSTTLLQAKTGKHECRNVTATFGIRAYLFSLTKGRATFLRPETIVASFMHFMVLLFKVSLNNSSKGQFSVLYCAIAFYSRLKIQFGEPKFYSLCTISFALFISFIKELS